MQIAVSRNPLSVVLLPCSRGVGFKVRLKQTYGLEVLTGCDSSTSKRLVIDVNVTDPSSGIMKLFPQKVCHAKRFQYSMVIGLYLNSCH